MSVYEELSLAVQTGKTKDVRALVQKAIDGGATPKEVLNDGLLEGMSVVGEKFKTGEIYVPGMLIAARAMSAGLETLKPYLSEGDVESKGKVVLGTVKGDLHDIGKNLVKIMMEGKGVEVIDLGVDVPAEEFVETAVREDAGIIACSALLTTTMEVMKDVVAAVEEKGLHGKVKVMVGGSPVTQGFCDTIGADYYAADAATAGDMAAKMLSQ